jgi:murein DD-endopeptidase MepM/ murein hydrolase activator NlpD
MSSKADKISPNLDRRYQSRIFFRNPILLKVVAWLGSLSVIGNTSMVWAELKPISASQTEAKALVQSSGSARGKAKIEQVRREVFGPYLPNSTTNRQVPIAIDPNSVSISQTGKMTVTQPVQIDPTLKVNGSELSIEIPVPPPRQATIPGSRELATKTKNNNQVQTRIGNSVPKTGIEISANRKSTSTMPTPVGLDASLPKGAKRSIKSTIVVPMKPSTIGKQSSTPTVASAPVQSEISIEIPVPQPLSQIIKVQPVAQLPKITTSGKVVPIVPPLPTVSNRTDVAQVQSKRLTLVTNQSSEQGVEIIYPLSSPAPITSPFGWRTHPITGSRRFHAGVDIGAPMGAPVVAAASGTIVAAGWMGGYGKAITIQHNGVQQTLYGHLSEVFVQPGQTIERGTVIGRVGSTGNSTGPHLHFENRMSTSDGWVSVDPGTEVKYALDNLRREIDVARKDLSPKIN